MLIMRHFDKGMLGIYDQRIKAYSYTGVWKIKYGKQSKAKNSWEKIKRLDKIPLHTELIYHSSLTWEKILWVLKVSLPRDQGPTFVDTCLFP